MHRLQQFAVGTIFPEWEKVMVNQKLQDENELPMMVLLVIESFLWLHLGFELGAFPRDETEDVYSFYYAPFFKWLPSYNTTRSHLPFLESAWYLGLPEFARAVVLEGVNGGKPLYIQPSGLGERQPLIGSFQSLLVLYSRLCRDAAVRKFLYGISFQSIDDWGAHWNEQCTAEDVFNAVESTEGTWTAMVLGGYMKFCEYLQNTSEILGSVEASGVLDQAALFRLKDRIREIHMWRLNLSSSDTATRFEQIRKSVNQMIEKELTDLASLDDVKRIQESLDSSLHLILEFAIA